MKLKTKTWLDDNTNNSLKLKSSTAWMVYEWKEDDKGGAGLCLYTEVFLNTGETLSVETIISKKNLAKALLMVLKKEKKDAC